MSKGTMKTPPPIPRSPAMKPITKPMAPPPITLLLVPTSSAAASVLSEKSMRREARKITPARMAVKILIFTLEVVSAPRGAARAEARMRGSPTCTSTIFLRK